MARKEATDMARGDVDRVVDIIEDRVMFSHALDIILGTTETRQLPPEYTLPVFNDSTSDEVLRKILENVTGCRYE
ncbi:MAG: hypothetical protein ACI4UJ_00155 [Candidatus Cryptobacteroides sp.]